MKIVWFTVCCWCNKRRSEGEYCITNKHHPQYDRWCYDAKIEPPIERVGRYEVIE